MLSSSRYVAGAEYTVPEDVRAYRQSRGDGLTYTGESSLTVIDGNGSGPIASAARSGKEIVIQNAADDPSFRRVRLAKQFGVQDIHFVPVAGGVLEYGRRG